MTHRATTRLTPPFVIFSAIAIASLFFTAPPEWAASPDLPREETVRISSGEEIKLYEGSYALVFGESDYINGWQPLPNVRKDVLSVKASLEKHGFNVEVVLNPTLATFDEKMREFIDKYGQGPENRLVVYFAGHGWSINAGPNQLLGYIVPSDAPSPAAGEGPFIRKAIYLGSINGYAIQMMSKHALFLFDSCFSGALIGDTYLMPFNPTVMTEQIARPVREYITAGTSGQEVSGDSIFCNQLVEGLDGAADLDRDGYVTGAELGKFLKEKVQYYTKGSQTPQLGKMRNPDLDKGDIVFTLPVKPKPPHPVPVTHDMQVAEMKLWIGVKEANGIDNYRTYLREYPSGQFAGEARRLLAKMYFDQGEKLLDEDRREDAETNLLAGLRLDPESVRGHLKMGSLFSRRHRWTEARREYTQVIKLDPNNPQAHYQLGGALKEQRHREESIAELNLAMNLVNAALQREPNNADLHGFKSGIYHYQEDYRNEEAEARIALKLSQQISPGNARWYERVGAALMAQQKWAEAEEVYRAALLLQPQSPRWHSSLGYVLSELGNFKQGEPEMRLALGLDPDGIQWHVNLGVALAKQKNRWTEAFAEYQRAIQLDPENGGLFHHVAYELSARDKYAEAEQFYRRAAQYDPKNAGQHADLGKNLVRLQKYAEAEVAYREAVRLDAANSEYRNELKKVSQKIGK
jgi:tetratricopeptide (TPR) repeat protein